MSILKETAWFTQFIISPFGLHEADCSCSDVAEEFDIFYHQWEESISRVIYTNRGIADAQIAASMHEYVEQKSDTEVYFIVFTILSMQY